MGAVGLLEDALERIAEYGSGLRSQLTNPEVAKNKEGISQFLVRANSTLEKLMVQANLIKSFIPTESDYSLAEKEMLAEELYSLSESKTKELQFKLARMKCESRSLAITCDQLRRELQQANSQLVSKQKSIKILVTNNKKLRESLKDRLPRNESEFQVGQETSTSDGTRITPETLDENKLKLLRDRFTR